MPQMGKWNVFLETTVVGIGAVPAVFICFLVLPDFSKEPEGHHTSSGYALSGKFIELV